MDADPVVLSGDGRQECDSSVPRIGAQCRQSECTVLPTAPRKYHIDHTKSQNVTLVGGLPNDWRIVAEMPKHRIINRMPATSQASWIGVIVAKAPSLRLPLLPRARRLHARQYVAAHEETSFPHGRISFGRSIPLLRRRSGGLAVEFEELSADSPANQVVKAAARVLVAVPDLRRQLRDPIAGVYRQLSDVYIGSSWKRPC